jgi:PKD repeat protein
VHVILQICAFSLLVTDLIRGFLRVSLLTMLLAAVSACGGGGGSSNRVPVASFTATPTSGEAPLTVSVNASGSTDSDGSIVSYSWNFGDGGTATGVTAQHVYNQAGTFTVTLTVSDNRGAQDQATRTVTVTGNEGPVAELQYTAGCSVAPLQASFDASRSYDPDGNIVSYSWNFGDGQTGSGATVAHTYDTAGTFPVTLTLLDDEGATSQARGTVTVLSGPGTGAVSVSGQVSFERVPHNASTTNAGLDYSRTFAAPARNVVVELVSSAGPVLASTVTSESGQYSFNAAADSDVFVRARAEACGTSPRWQVRVMNNTQPDPLTLYVLDSAVFNTGTTSQTKNLLADSGWPDFGGISYTGPRAAAPFAVLDTLTSAVKFVHANGAAVDLPALNAFWSKDNRVSDEWTPSNGGIQSTLFRGFSYLGAAPGIYVLGLVNNDTDEFDEHVVAHEFNHYLEDAISRSDTPGGAHGPTERIDMRLAFSEGFSNAFSGMVVDSLPLREGELPHARYYKDSSGDRQLSGFTLDLEQNSQADPGWFNESTIHSILWDVFDAPSDGVDDISLGYGPLYDVTTAELRNGAALTSIYPMLQGLKSRSPGSAATIDAMAQSRRILGTGQYGIGEVEDGGVTEALPVYTELTLNGAAKRVCGTTEVGVYNKLGNRLFLRFSLGATQPVTIRAQYTSTGSASSSITPDPDIVLYRSGLFEVGWSEDANVETLTRTLAAGDYVIEVYEYSHIEDGATARRGVTCFNVSVVNQT